MRVWLSGQALASQARSEGFDTPGPLQVIPGAMLKIEGGGRFMTCGWLLVSSWPSKPTPAGSIPVARSNPDVRRAGIRSGERHRCQRVVGAMRDVELAISVWHAKSHVPAHRRRGSTVTVDRPGRSIRGAVCWDMRQQTDQRVCNSVGRVPSSKLGSPGFESLHARQSNVLVAE